MRGCLLVNYLLAKKTCNYILQILANYEQLNQTNF